MTNKQRVLRIFGVIMVLLFASCQKEDDLPPLSSVEEGPIIKVFRGAKAKSRNVATNRLLQQQGISTNGKLKISTEGDGNRGMDEIEINYAKVMETDDSFGNKHLTYEGVKENAPETTFYNIVITEKEGKSKIVLVKYEMEPSFLDEYQLTGKIENFRGTVTFTEVFSDSDFPCNQNPSIPIPVNPGDGSGPGGGGGSGGGGGGGGADANPPPSGSNPGYSQGLVDAQFLALSFQAAVAWGNSEDGYYEVSSSPRYQRIAPIIVDPSNPCGGGLEIGIMEPTLPQDNCHELKKLVDTNHQGPNIKTKLATLIGQINPANEIGFTMEKLGNNYSNIVIPTNPNAPNSVTFRNGPNIYGAAHTHRIGFDPMFSWGDVYGLYEIYKETAPENRAAVVVLLACQDSQGGKHVYAIKVDDFNALEQKLLDDLAGVEGNTFAEKKDNIQKNNYHAMFERSSNNFERTFLNYFANTGISLYQATDDLNNWNKLTLDTSSPPFDCCENIIKTPCN